MCNFTLLLLFFRHPSVVGGVFPRRCTRTAREAGLNVRPKHPRLGFRLDRCDRCTLDGHTEGARTSSCGIARRLCAFISDPKKHRAQSVLAVRDPFRGSEDIQAGSLANDTVPYGGMMGAAVAVRYPMFYRGCVNYIFTMCVRSFFFRGNGEGGSFPV